MRSLHTAALSTVALILAAVPALAQDTSRAVTDGGVKVPGWTGRIDAREAAAGQTLDNAKLEAMGSGMHVTTGPAVAYWNPANTASGTYMVKATFNEPQYMNRNNHPHPYGVFIGGADMGTDQQSYLYCAAYGNGRFVMRGFGPAAFQMNARGEANAAIKKAAAQNESVTNEIAVSVRGDNVECAVNGTVVGTYPKASLVTAGKLKSTDGVYGIRVGHNAEVHVEGFALAPAVTK